jgi:hypothetical protein
MFVIVFTNVVFEGGELHILAVSVFTKFITKVIDHFQQLGHLIAINTFAT